MARSDQTNNPDWKTLGFDRKPTARWRCPTAPIGFRWGESGKWNIEEKDARDGADAPLALTLAETRDARACRWRFPISAAPRRQAFHADRSRRRAGAQPAGAPADDAGRARCYVATVFDLLVGNYGIDRGFGGGNVADEL